MFLTEKKTSLTNEKNARPYQFGYTPIEADGKRTYYIIENSRIFAIRDYRTPTITTETQAVEVKALPSNLTQDIKFLTENTQTSTRNMAAMSEIKRLQPKE
jgi:hypothetical protein